MPLSSKQDRTGGRAAGDLGSPYWIEGSLRPAWRGILFLLPILAGGVWLSGEVIRVAQVTFQVNTVSIPDIHRALARDPNNADLAHRLGLVYASSPTDSDYVESAKYLRQAVQLNPRRWDFWADLGTTCDFLMEAGCSDEAFARALALNPMAPFMQWTLGNHYLLSNRPEQAFPRFRQLLEMDLTYLLPTLRLCLRATRDPQEIYARVIPSGKDATARFDFLRYLTSTADYENAMKIWGQMVSGPDRTPEMALVKPFLDFLIDHNQIQDAATVWSDLQHAGVVPAGQASSPNDLIYNGGFERPPLNTGFDWRVNGSPELEYDFADPSAYKGNRCLRIRFAVGRNGDYNLLDQVVLVKPDTKYQLTAFVRSDNLTSESGPRWRVVEVGCGGCGTLTSDPTLGTTPWHSTDLTFMTQPQTQAVRISFWRPRDLTFRSDITGNIWLDDVSLREAGTADFNPARTR